MASHLTMQRLQVLAVSEMLHQSFRQDMLQLYGADSRLCKRPSFY